MLKLMSEFQNELHLHVGEGETGEFVFHGVDRSLEEYYATVSIKNENGKFTVTEFHSKEQYESLEDFLDSQSEWNNDPAILYNVVEIPEDVTPITGQPVRKGKN